MLLNPDLTNSKLINCTIRRTKCARERLPIYWPTGSLPAFSDRFSRFQATTWLTLEWVFEECTNFDSRKRPEALYLVEMLNQSEGSVCRNIPPAVSQSSAVEQHNQLVAEGAIPVSGLIAGDATNSCFFLSVLIAQ